MLRYILILVLLLASSAFFPVTPRTVVRGQDFMSMIRVGDRIDVLWGLPGVVTDIGPIGYGVTLEETTCWGDLVEQGLVAPISPLPGVTLPDGSDAMFSGKCGRQPVHTTALSVPDTDVIASDTEPSIGNVYQNTWLYAAQDIDTTDYASEAIALNLEGKKFKVNGDYFQYVWVGSTVNVVGNPNTAFFHTGIWEGGPLLTNAEIPDNPYFAFQIQNTLTNVWTPLWLLDSVPVSLTGFNFVMNAVEPIFNSNFPGGGDDVIFGAVSSDLVTMHIMPHWIGTALADGTPALGRTTLKGGQATTETANQNASVPSPGVGTYRETINNVATVGLLRQASLASSWNFAPHLAMGPSGHPSLDLRPTCPPLSRIFVTNLWVDFNDSSGHYCPSGVVW